MQEADHRVKDALRLRPHLATAIHSNVDRELILLLGVAVLASPASFA